MSIVLVAVPLGAIAIAVLIAAAVIHVYWALGGRMGKSAAIPETIKGPVFRPKALSTLLVAAGLLIAAAVVAVRIGLLTTPLPEWLPRAACALLALVFLTRAVGDFHYLGFFKRVKGTRFARLDSSVYAPLCLFLAIAIGATVW